MTSRFTPADMEYLFQQVAQFSFEQELATNQDYRVTADTIFEIMPKIQPSLTDKIIAEFEKDSSTYSRFWYSRLYILYGKNVHICRWSLPETFNLKLFK